MPNKQRNRSENVSGLYGRQKNGQKAVLLLNASPVVSLYDHTWDTDTRSRDHATRSTMQVWHDDDHGCRLGLRAQTETVTDGHRMRIHSTLPATLLCYSTLIATHVTTARQSNHGNTDQLLSDLVEVSAKQVTTKQQPIYLPRNLLILTTLVTVAPVNCYKVYNS